MKPADSYHFLSYFKTFVLVSFSLCFGVEEVSSQGFSPEDSVKRMKVADGFEVELVAAEPDIKQPLSMTFDAKGRIWVIQYLQYPFPAGLSAVSVDKYLRTKYDKLPDPPPHGPKGADKITICEDTDGDGRCDTFKDFVAGLNLASGFALGHGGVFVLQAPYLLFYPDKNSDDVPDGDPEVLLTGFGMEDAHAVANSLVWGPDGWLYGAQGSTVTANIRGITFQQGIWRYHPKTKEFELFSEGGGNTWGLDFDAQGNIIAGTNHGRKAMLHQVQGAYYIKNFGKHGALQNPYAYGYFDHVKYEGFQGGHVTCGGIIYQEDQFDEKYRNQYIAANILSNEIHWHKVIPYKSTFKNQHGGKLIEANDTWFRPIDCLAGPDGAVYILDWYDKRANHVDPRDNWDKTNGRIYRLKKKGAKSFLNTDLHKKSEKELIEIATKDTRQFYVRQARRMLVDKKHGEAELKFKQSAKELEGEQALNAFWGYLSLLNKDPRHSDPVLDDEFEPYLLSTPEMRLWSIRYLFDQGKIGDVIAYLLRAPGDESDVRVRTQLACSLKRLNGKQAIPLIFDMIANKDDRDDPQIPMLLWWALEEHCVKHIDLAVKYAMNKDLLEAPIYKEIVLPRLIQRWAAEGTPASLAAVAGLTQFVDPSESALAKVYLGCSNRDWDTVPESFRYLFTEEVDPAKAKKTLIQLGLLWKNSATVSQANEVLVNDANPDSLVSTWLSVIKETGTKIPDDVLVTLLDQRKNSKLKQTAVELLQLSNEDKVKEALLSRVSKETGSVRSSIVNALCSRETWAEEFFQVLDKQTELKKNVDMSIRQRVAVFDNEKINQVLGKHFGSIERESSAVRKARMHGIRVYMRRYPNLGDVENGKKLFTKHCAVCHQMFGEGNKIGPDLTGADRGNYEFLLTNIVDPSASMREQYKNYVLITTDGRVLTGIIAESNPTSITILDAKNKRTVVKRDEIDELTASKLSLMPEKLLDQLTAEQISDLFKYLQTNVKKKE